jgi:hypothetical protein
MTDAIPNQDQLVSQPSANLSKLIALTAWNAFLTRLLERCVKINFSGVATSATHQPLVFFHACKLKDPS